MKNYTHLEALVTTQWVANHLHDPQIRLVEANEDILLYDTGHIQGAIKIDWQNDLQDPVIRDYIRPEQFEELMSRKGISPDHQVIFYGDKNNWWACYAFWAFKLYGHKQCSIMDGGRQKWIQESRPLTKDIPHYPAVRYKVHQFNEKSIRAFREEVILHVRAKKPLIDVRTPQEFTGELLHMESYPQEGALRGGHIPRAQNIPWSTAVNSDGTFKSYQELQALYQNDGRLKPDEEIITYCRIGERSAHTWFVLKYLLGYPKVRNYDGSWTEWGNLVRAPIEK